MDGVTLGFLALWGVLLVVACGVLVATLFLAAVLHVAGRESDREEQEGRAW